MQLLLARGLVKFAYGQLDFLILKKKMMIMVMMSESRLLGSKHLQLFVAIISNLTDILKLLLYYKSSSNMDKLVGTKHSTKTLSLVIHRLRLKRKPTNKYVSPSDDILHFAH